MKSNSEIILKNNNTFISISIIFKVFKNLCLNENDETLFLKKMHINYSCTMNLEKKIIRTIKNIACIP